MEYRELTGAELDDTILDVFDRRQDITLQWEKDPSSGRWIVAVRPHREDWSSRERQEVVQQLRAVVTEGGLVLGAFDNDVLRGFLAIDGNTAELTEGSRLMTHLYVSKESRSQGMGTLLFLRGADWARQRGVKKLRIFAHPAVETQGFFLTLGCLDIADPVQESAPGNRNLEYQL